ncbi:lectin-like [Trematomus bernacchii]|uniref:lectin-like n=1 Tax=Trematomus bernacchii TaxID=40690 RepID=UPI00146A4E8D|nr:lectin-like [Trematomus bernacchii]XP_034003726.1 lectin-like [Trematomus bernacchii]
MSRNFLSGNDELRKGDSLVSNNGRFKAVFQEDGNFVVYGWTPVWASDTYGSDAFRLIMQNDCNLVIYNNGGKALWDTRSNGAKTDVCRLQLTDDGKLVVSKAAEVVWTASK